MLFTSGYNNEKKNENCKLAQYRKWVCKKTISVYSNLAFIPNKFSFCSVDLLKHCVRRQKFLEKYIRGVQLIWKTGMSWHCHCIYSCLLIIMWQVMTHSYGNEHNPPLFKTSRRKKDKLFITGSAWWWPTTTYPTNNKSSVKRAI